MSGKVTGMDAPTVCPSCGMYHTVSGCPTHLKRQLPYGDLGPFFMPHQNTLRQGWQCPGCKTYYAPTVTKCTCSRKPRKKRR